MGTNVSTIYGSGDTLKYDDLKGRTWTLRIAGSRVQHFAAKDDMPESTRIVLSFDGAQKELALNGKSARALAAVWGDDADLWVGQSVLLIPTAGSVAKFNSITAMPAPTPMGAPAVPPPAAPVVPDAPLSDDEVPF